VAGTGVCIDMGDRGFLQKASTKMRHTDNNNCSLQIFPIVFISMFHTQFSVSLIISFPSQHPFKVGNIITHIINGETESQRG
jgi:hypothetical protein